MIEKYGEPQIYVVNNSEIADELRNNYIVDEGNLGIVKQIEYGKYINQRYVNLEYDLISNLHEYKVVIIDLQNEMKKIVCSKDESLYNFSYLFRVEYPSTKFNPVPIVMHEIVDRMNKNSLRIIFANYKYSEEYNPVELLGRDKYRDRGTFEQQVYSTIGSYTNAKKGKKIVVENIDLAKIVSKYVLEYRVIFDLPNKNYIPLILNQDKEVISYIGYDENRGYELLLPVCREKEKLIDELFKKVLPDILPKIFPESKQFDWLKNEEFQPKEILVYKEEKQRLRELYERQLSEIEDQEKTVHEKYRFLNELLTETGQVLVEAVKEYLKWLGYKDIRLIDGNEEVLREDIQIHDGDDLFIVEVKGIGGTSTDAECSQVAKHRRKREKEYRNKNVVPIYIVNHQRYINPTLRENPPFSKDQIDYAENDERGLLTTWQLYQQYKLIEDGIFTKEETRLSMKKTGLITLLPNDFRYMGKIKEYYKRNKASILDIRGIEIKVGDAIWARKDITWIKGKVCSIQINDQNVEKADRGEIGIVLDVELNKGFELFVKN